MGKGSAARRADLPTRCFGWMERHSCHITSALQTEAFGNASLVIVAQNVEEACKIVGKLEGQLTGCIYSDTSGVDDANYAMLAPILRQRVGRLHQ